MTDSEETYQLIELGAAASQLVDESVSTMRKAIESQRELSQRTGQSNEPTLAVMTQYVDDFENHLHALRRAKANGLSLPESPSFPEIPPSYKSS